MCAMHLEIGKRQPGSQLYILEKRNLITTERAYSTNCRSALSQQDVSFMIVHVSSWENLWSSFENKFLNTALSPKNLA